MIFSPLLLNYIAAEIFSPFIAAFFITNGILILGQVIPLFTVIIDLGISVPNLLRLIAFMAPKILLFSLPLASMLGIVLGVSRLASEGDILTFKACGISLNKLLPPVILFAFANSVMTAYCAAELKPLGELSMNRLLFQMAKEKFDRNIKPRQFSEGTGKIILYIDEIDESTRQWRGVYIADMRNAGKPIFLLAKQAHFVADSQTMIMELHLDKGTIHITGKETVETVGFDRFQFTLPLDPPQEIAGERAEVIGKSAMRLGRLLTEAEKYEGKGEGGLPYLIEFHTRLLIPVGGFFLSLLALPLGTLSRPGRRAMGIPLALGVYIGYYLLVTGARIIVEQGHLPPAPVLWSVNLILAAVAIIFVRLSVNDSLYLLQERWHKAFLFFER